MREWDDALERQESENGVQWHSEEVKAVLTILCAREKDPAYALGILATAVMQAAHEIRDDPENSDWAEMMDECTVDLLRLRHSWLARYSELKENLEARRAPLPRVVQ